MTEQVTSVLTAVGVLFGIAGVAGTLYAGAKGSANEATTKRLRDENADYLSRLNYVEPRMQAAEKQNEVLMALNNPQPALKGLGDQIETSHEAITRILEDQNRTLKDIARKVKITDREHFDDH